jgi:hypothetical protein
VLTPRAFVLSAELGSDFDVGPTQRRGDARDKNDDANDRRKE